MFEIPQREVLLRSVELPSVWIWVRGVLLHRVAVGARLGEREGPEANRLRARLGEGGSARGGGGLRGTVLGSDGEAERLGAEPTPLDGLVDHGAGERGRRRRIDVVEARGRG